MSTLTMCGRSKGQGTDRQGEAPQGETHTLHPLSRIFAHFASGGQFTYNSSLLTQRLPPYLFSFTKRVDLRSLYHAALAAPLLGADVSQGSSVLEKVLDLLGSDGSVRWVQGIPELVYLEG